MLHHATKAVTRFQAIWLLVTVVVVVLVAANAHLAYVAISSQPDCVAHLKDKGGQPGQFRAAKPAC
ncbi:hypothetical protein GOZ83_12890 [Agrobacterium vitis]|uniref:Transmembrane protein n=2 Tax=Alphaproteobacteria TaxID=28211 RepID=A0A512HM58_9HYPH|nr:MULTISPECIES: hypothetical protein [Alphaproteobacteria]MCF1494455.1 hypothetical protein [Allorhizobium ampelinum]MVA45961.1 hypothetical protein [Agrobacterium vitis]GEO86480.1 hypothetical protein RNA01_34120 [Ciceribacter naphthalenivorans]GLR23837.1 hypothetical protein GCM10007920_36290 [Ciceribacter naphthalenivorans]GLT06693.1 hypothetical protein GCM10007926_36290 [Sphingomonas psychrolutea]